MPGTGLRILAKASSPLVSQGGVKGQSRTELHNKTWKRLALLSTTILDIAWDHMNTQRLKNADFARFPDKHTFLRYKKQLSGL